ncbi:uncharacterized protein CLUP02_04464 [Colletotrichum lupini]|uniref:Secreted protein n=2 Tax=Colletotrichum acutatum species complex TaxID=2707335 RepID=A0A9Q8SL91_9PEZI|nr:uncharacterized protein CLUP02_04464 [Colletotrichum lupini]XP_060308732.1 uncharacterized protein CCOS01_12536 [Colletotrichum costaricense]KAK1516987.1 hypothetical protein CCOS01_12536 [Colletotrichum costaricense]KAK1701983.1 hypothetical protein BDP67DRAFT_281756 [Colletotrichum lupini]UQC78985.1 hypothetical protein CLUP02_04464 [Colletotrichum lupini]
MRCHCERCMAMWSAAVLCIGLVVAHDFNGCRWNQRTRPSPVGPDIVGLPGFSASGFGEGAQGGVDSADITDSSGRRRLNGVLSRYRGRNHAC